MIIKKSPCKINLFLDIKSKREDGYHLIESLFHTIDLFDIIKIEEDKEFKISTSGKYKLNDNEENIVSKIFYYFKNEMNLKKNYKINIEKNIPNKELLIKKFINISDRFKKDKIVWRYDPIILNKEFNSNYHIKNFSYISSALKNYTDECIFSFVQIYSKIKNVFKDINNDIEERKNLINDLKEIASKNNIILKNCSQSFDNIENSSCIDKNRIENILGYKIKENKDKGQRKLCNCIKSVDIGTYNTCQNGCIYCYANK